ITVTALVKAAYGLLKWVKFGGARRQNVRGSSVRGRWMRRMTGSQHPGPDHEHTEGERTVDDDQTGDEMPTRPLLLNDLFRHGIALQTTYASMSPIVAKPNTLQARMLA